MDHHQSLLDEEKRLSKQVHPFSSTRVSRERIKLKWTRPLLRTWGTPDIGWRNMASIKACPPPKISPFMCGTAACVVLVLVYFYCAYICHSLCVECLCITALHCMLIDIFLCEPSDSAILVYVVCCLVWIRVMSKNITSSIKTSFLPAQ